MHHRGQANSRECSASTPCWRSVRWLTVAVLVPLCTVALGAAATLGGLTTNRVGASSSTVASCDTNGVTVSYAFTGTNVSSVTVAGLADPGCEGALLSVTLANSAQVSIGAGGPVTIPVDGGTADNSRTVTLNPQPAASTVSSVHVLVNGP